MKINPVAQSEAPEKTRQLYESLKTALQSNSLPLYFTYLGAFPEYLEYITSQLTSNLRDPNFLHICEETKKVLLIDISKTLKHSEQVTEWLARNKYSPQFHYFQEDLSLILTTTIKLVYLFIGLREAVKGWAVAAKKLPDVQVHRGPQEKQSEYKSDEFVFGGLMTTSQPGKAQNTPEGLVRSAGASIEKNLLSEYFFLCQHDFNTHLNTDVYWELRIRQEKYILSLLAMLPHLIFSPYNVIVPLTRKYENFPELLHMLSEHFPTYSMQRMIFSGCMKAE